MAARIGETSRGFTHRSHDPTTGRFVTRDPIGQAGGINVYGYVGGDPVNWSDPSGLCSQNQAAHCAKLLRQINEAIRLLTEKSPKYDPVEDAKYNTYQAGGKVRTSPPGGHFWHLIEIQKGLIKNMIEFFRDCKGQGNLPAMAPIWAMAQWPPPLSPKAPCAPQEEYAHDETGAIFVVMASAGIAAAVDEAAAGYEAAAATAGKLIRAFTH